MTDEEQHPREHYADWYALREEYDRLGAALAAQLNADRIEGGGWSHTPGLNAFGSVRLEHSDGLGFSLTHEGSHRKGPAGQMLRVSGCYPSDYSGDPAPTINVGKGRPPRAMAADIVNRFLPGYLATARRALTEHERHLAEERARVALNRRLEQALPALRPSAGYAPHERPARRVSYFHKESSRGPHRALASGKIQINADAGEVSLRLDALPADLAVQILEMVNPEPALNGRVMPRELPHERPALQEAARTLPGEVLARILADSSREPRPEPARARQQPAAGDEGATAGKRD